MTEFVEARLELGINYGAVYGPRFSTAIAAQADGREIRRALWSQGLVYAQLGEKVVTQAELDYLLEFHRQTMGAYRGFRLKDWSDYKAVGQPLTGDGEGNYQLVKRYCVGNVCVTRPITKPVEGTVKLYANGTEQTQGWTINHTTGVIQTAIAGTLTADFEFDVPVRFEQDKIDFKFEAGTVAPRKLFILSPLNCTEIRLQPAIAPDLDAHPDKLLHTIQLGYDHGTLGGPSFNTLISTNAAEFESRQFLWSDPIGSWEIGDRTLNRTELDYLLALFRVCRGRSVEFRFKDWQDEETKPVRFGEDRIALRFDAYRSTDEQVIFGLGGVQLTQVIPPPPPPPTPQEVTVTYNPGLLSTNYILFASAPQYGRYDTENQVIGTWKDTAGIYAGPITVTGTWTAVGNFGLNYYAGFIINGVNVGWGDYTGVDQGELYVYPKNIDGTPGIGSIGQLSWQIRLFTGQDYVEGQADQLGVRETIQLPETNLNQIVSVKNGDGTITYTQGVDYVVVSLVNGQIRPTNTGSIIDGQTLKITYT